LTLKLQNRRDESNVVVKCETFLQGDSLGDVPDPALVVHEDQSVGSGQVVEGRCLLVAKEHVGNPDLLPTVVTELQLGTVVVLARIEYESTVVPLLT